MPKEQRPPYEQIPDFYARIDVWMSEGQLGTERVERLVNTKPACAYASLREQWAQHNKPLEERWLYHGTRRESMVSIFASGFDLKRLGSTTGNRGCYGAGIYLTPLPALACSYSRIGVFPPPSATAVLLCKVLLGRTVILSAEEASRGKHMGMELLPGYDSHLSPGDVEVVCFDSAQVLPVAILHLTLAR